MSDVWLVEEMGLDKEKELEVFCFQLYAGQLLPQAVMTPCRAIFERW